jgi:hypothetical protein
MKKLLILTVVLLFVSTMFAAEPTPTSARATSSVYIQVAPAIAVSSATPLVDLGSIMSGMFSATLTWRVDANQEAVQFFLEASDLYKGDNPLDGTVAPIALNTFMKAGIIAEAGNEMNAGDNQAAWVSVGDNIGSYPTKKTETVSYESSQNGHFSQNITSTIFYIQPNPEQPTGQYSGKVRLTAIL